MAQQSSTKETNYLSSKATAFSIAVLMSSKEDETGKVIAEELFVGSMSMCILGESIASWIFVVVAL